MLFDLKTQELMHGFQSLGVRSADEYFAAAIRLDVPVRKIALHPLHISFGYPLKVLADLIPRGRIGWQMTPKVYLRRSPTTQCCCLLMEPPP
jgi:hypothetical protein